MTNDPVRLVAVDEPRGGETAEILKQLQERTLVLLAGLGRAPTRLRIKAGEVELALEWPRPAATAIVGAAAAAAVPDGAAVPAAGTAGSTAAGAGGHHVTAHTVGVFHHAPAPGAEPFVKVGDTVQPGQQVGIIEAMKLMIAVEAETAGRITEVLVPNATPVEYGEKLFAFEPA